MPRPNVPAAPTADLELLVLLAVIARERSFTRAAAVLGVSQPSISARVRRLELRAGEPVFERLGRGVRLTPTGEALLPAAERALTLAQEADELWS
ncbi:MAG: LysR family transcriptional regulator, partial [Gemmatimonadaceae bacterium]